MIEPGTKAPDFTLPNHRGEDVSLADFRAIAASNPTIYNGRQG